MHRLMRHVVTNDVVMMHDAVMVVMMMHDVVVVVMMMMHHRRRRFQSGLRRDRRECEGRCENRARDKFLDH
jgi:hypothetical protein